MALCNAAAHAVRNTHHLATSTHHQLLFASGPLAATRWPLRSIALAGGVSLALYGLAVPLRLALLLAVDLPPLTGGAQWSRQPVGLCFER